VEQAQRFHHDLAYIQTRLPEAEKTALMHQLRLKTPQRLYRFAIKAQKN